jgi:hypothetical protein
LRQRFEGFFSILLALIAVSTRSDAEKLGLSPRQLLASSELSILEVGLRTPAANRAGPGPASSPGLRRIHAHSARVRRPH